MKRIVALVCLVSAAAFATTVALAGSGNGGNGHGHHGHVIHVIEHATTDAVTNQGDGSGDVAGDVLTFNNGVFNEHDSTQVGSDQGHCVRIVAGQSWECIWTTILDHRGQLTVEGPFYDTSDSKLAVTGGTGAFSNARGWMQLHALNGGAEYDFIFHLTG